MYPKRRKKVLEGSEGGGGAEKGRLLVHRYEGNWLGTKNDCIAVLFVCVWVFFLGS